MHCDALGHGIGTTFIQEVTHLTFQNFELKGKNILRTIYEKEMLGIQHVVKK